MEKIFWWRANPIQRSAKMDKNKTCMAYLLSPFLDPILLGSVFFGDKSFATWIDLPPPHTNAILSPIVELASPSSPLSRWIRIHHIHIVIQYSLSKYKAGINGQLCSWTLVVKVKQHTSELTVHCFYFIPFACPVGWKTKNQRKGILMLLADCSLSLQRPLVELYIKGDCQGKDKRTIHNIMHNHDDHLSQQQQRLCCWLLASVSLFSESWINCCFFRFPSIGSTFVPSDRKIRWRELAAHIPKILFSKEKVPTESALLWSIALNWT